MKNILILVFALLLSSCVTFEKCQEKYGQLSQDSVKVPTTITGKAEVELTAPADSAHTTINTDSLEPGKVYTVKSADGNAKISYWKDLYTNLLHTRADCPEQKVKDTVPVTVSGVVNCPPQTVFCNHKPPPEPGAWQKAWEGFRFASAWVLLIQLLLFFIMLINYLRRCLQKV